MKWQLGLWILLISLGVFAQEIKERVVYVPLEDWANVIKIESKGVRLSYQQYQDLLARQQKETLAPPTSLVIHDVEYQGRIEHKSLHIEMNILFTSLKNEPIELALNLGNFGVETAFLDDQPARIRAELEPIIQTNVSRNLSPLADNFVRIEQQEQQQQQQQNNLPVQRRIMQQQQIFVQNAPNIARQESNLLPPPPDEMRPLYYFFCQGQGQHRIKILGHIRLTTQKDELHGRISLANFPNQIFFLQSQPEFDYTSDPIYQKAANEKLALYLGNRSDFTLMVRPKEQKDTKESLFLTTVTSSHLVRPDSLVSWFQVSLDVRHRPQKNFSFAIPANLEIVNITENRWEVKTENEKKIINLQFDEEILGIRKFTLKCERQVLEDAEISLPKLQMLGDKLFHQEDYIHIEKSEDVTLEISHAEQVRQLNIQNQNYFFTKKAAPVEYIDFSKFNQEIIAEYKSSTPSYQILLKKKSVITRLESTFFASVTFSQDNLVLKSDIKFDVLEGKAKELTLVLPSTEWRLTSVELTTSVYSQNIHPNYYIKNGIIFIPLDNQLSKGQSANVVCEFQNLSEDWRSNWENQVLAVPWVKPISAEFKPSLIGIIADSDYQIDIADAVHAVSLDRELFVQQTRVTNPNLALCLKLNRLEAKISLNIRLKQPYKSVIAMHYVSVEPERIRHAIILVYDVKDGSTDALYFIFPKNFNQLININSEKEEKLEIKEKIHTLTEFGHEWKIIPKLKVSGKYSIYINYEIPIISKNMVFSLPILKYPQVHTQRGYIGITTISQAKVEVTTKEGLSIVPIGQFPQEISHPEFPIDVKFLYTYKFANNDFSLGLNITLYDKLPVINAILESVDISTTYPEKNLERVMCKYQLNHLGRQFFDVQIPQNANFWGAVVNDKGEKPLQKDGMISIPIPRHNDGRSDIISVVYERKVPELGKLGQISLQCPKTMPDIPIKNCRWDVYLPLEYKTSTILTEKYYEPWYETLANAILEIPSHFTLKYESSYRYDKSTITPSSAPLNDGYGYELPESGANEYEQSNISPKQELAGKKGRIAPPAKPTVRPSLQDKRKAPMSAPKTMKPNAQLARRDAERRIGEERQKYKEESKKEFVQENKSIEMDELVLPPSPSMDASAPEMPEPVMAEKASEYSDDDMTIASGAIKEEEYEETEVEPVEETATDETTTDEEGTGDTKIPKDALAPQKPMKGIAKESGILGAKVIGVPSLNVDIAPQDLYIGNKISQPIVPGQADATVLYIHDDSLRSLELLLLGVSVAFGLFLFTCHKAPRISILLTILLVISFIPILLGRWLMPYCNMIAWGFLLSLPVRWIYLLLTKIGNWLTNKPAVSGIILILALLPILQAQENLTVSQNNLGQTQTELSSEVPTIYIPYNPEKMQDMGPSTSVFIPYNYYQKLWNQAYPDKTIETPKTEVETPYYLYNARYYGEVKNNEATFEVQFMLEVKKAPTVIPLGLAGTAVKKAVLQHILPGEQIQEKSLSLRPDVSGNYTILMAETGNYCVKLSLVTPGKIENKRGEILLSLQPVATSILEFTLDEDVEINLGDWQGDWLEKISNSRKVLLIFPGMSKNIKIQWYQSSERSRARGLNIAVKSQHKLSVSDQVLRLNSVLQYQIISGKTDKLLLQVPQDFQILHLQCTNLERWILAQENNQSQIILRLVNDSQSQITLEIKAEKVLSQLPYRQIFPEIVPIDATRENGTIELGTHNSYSSLIYKNTNLRKMSSNQAPTFFWETFQYNQHPFELDFQISEQKPNNISSSNLNMKVDEEKISVDYQMTVNVRGQELFGQEIKLPLDYKILKVQGDDIKDWRISQSEKEQILRLIWKLNFKRGDTVSWNMTLEKQYLSDDEKNFDIPYIYSPNVQYQSGNILIASSPDILLNVLESKGLEKADVASHSTSDNKYNKRHAFRFEGSDYSAKIQREMKSPELECTAVAIALVEDDWLSFGYYLSYKINLASVQTFQFSIAEAIGENLDIIGENIKETKKEKRGKFYEWKVILHTKVSKEYSLKLFPRLQENSGTGFEIYPIKFAIEGIRNRTYILVQNQSQYELREQLKQSISDVNIQIPLQFLTDMNAKDFIFAYKVDRRDWRITFSEDKQQVVPTIRASIDGIKIESSISEYGECRQSIIYNIRHLGLQFLELEKPRNVIIWGVFVADRFLRPVQQQDTILIPLQYNSNTTTQRQQEKESKLTVKIIYSFQTTLFSSGKCHLYLPTIINIKEIGDVHWTAYLPKGYVYKFGGNISQGQPIYFQEYTSQEEYQQRVQIPLAPSQQDLSSTFSNENRLKEAAIKIQKRQQEQLFNDIQMNKAPNKRSLEQLQSQYGQQNVVDVQEATRGTRSVGKIYQETNVKKFAGENMKDFASRQVKNYQQRFTEQQKQAKDDITLFHFALLAPSDSKYYYFANKQGDANLEIRSYREPYQSRVWRTIQFILLILLLIFSWCKKLFSIDDGYSWSKLGWTILIIFLAILISTSLDVVLYFYL